MLFSGSYLDGRSKRQSLSNSMRFRARWLERFCLAQESRLKPLINSIEEEKPMPGISVGGLVSGLASGLLGALIGLIMSNEMVVTASCVTEFCLIETVVGSPIEGLFFLMPEIRFSPVEPVLVGLEVAPKSAMKPESNLPVSF